MGRALRAMHTLHDVEVKGARKIASGKVREIFDAGGGLMLIVTTDRISAFDVVLPDAIPAKGCVLNQTSLFWFEKCSDVVSNHVVSSDVREYPAPFRGDERLDGRSMLVRKARPLPVECIVRGYLSGSGWKEYRQSGSVSGVELPDGLRESDRLDGPIFTPSTKAAIGDHDQNIDFEAAASLMGRPLAEKVRDISLEIYEKASAHALGRGIIVADTKFEFGLIDGEIVWIDEAITPDSSRFWPLDGYRPGGPQPSFDKQYVRDYLESIGWDKKAPGPRLPDDVIRMTSEKYISAYERLTGMSFRWR
jgi:phosphoribosylaminoimidazole-succinocarboxamide synthase